MIRLISILFITMLIGPLWAQTRTPVADTSVITLHEVTVKGKRFQYRATTGFQPVWDEKDKITATLYYTYYERTGIQDEASRPLVISFNGGPGSASVWMHLAYTGPRLIKIDAEGYPTQPYGFTENAHTILDVADILYINPVNTGYSRILDSAVDRKTFFGINADIDYLADWINTFVTRHDRWLSPKYLIGESYGTTRVSGLALALQEQEWMYLNGVILVSPTDLGIARDGIVKAATRLPYFAAAAWYHNVLPADLQQLTLGDLLSKVERFAMEEFLPALAQGGFIKSEYKESIAKEVAHYSGISKLSVLQNNLDIPLHFFWKELLRTQGKTVGRLDSRYLGIDLRDAGDRPDYNAELASWLHAFTPPINHYLRTELNYKTDTKYNMLGPVHPWDNSDNNTGENLRQAMAENPYLNVMFQSGYFDGATNYFDSKYSMQHLDPSGKMKDRLYWKGYESGHMMYLRSEDLAKATEDIRVFIKNTTPVGKPAKY